MFEPPFCPHSDCDAHTARDGRFFVRSGSYDALCRPQPVPRFRCKLCGRSFSRQTFRADYRDKRPELNAELLSRMCSGGGLRQTARELCIRRRSLELKLWKMAGHLRGLHRNLMGDLGSAEHEVELALDELLTFEGERSTRPLTVPILIHQDAFFVVATAVGRTPASGKMTRARRRRLDALATREGPRRDESRAVCAEVLELAASRCTPNARVRLRSDRKRTYPGLAKRAFGGLLLGHRRIHSKQPRNPSNPLHRINLMLAILRDLMGRLRRRSWLVSKCGDRLAQHLDVLTAYRNYHRPRFNNEERTPAQLLGLVPRALTRGELLAWRQDAGPEWSIHPLAARAETVSSYAARFGRGAGAVADDWLGTG